MERLNKKQRIMTTKNPFEQHEDWQSWFEQDKHYLKHRRNSMRAYLKHSSLESPNIFMTLKDNYLKFIYFTAKHTVLTAFIALILITGVGAAAAETLAPTDLKPSTLAKNLFAANKQQDKDPYTALKPDENNYVTKLNECDLALKFPKKIDGLETKYYQNILEQGGSYNIAITNVEITADYVYQPANKEISTNLSIDCVPTDSDWGKKVAQDTVESGDQKDTIQKQKISKETLQSESGWFITQADIQNITKYSKTNSYGGKFLSYSFIFKNKIYSIKSGTTTDKTLINLIQLQFNSIVQNSFSDQLPLEQAKQATNIKSCFDRLDIKYSPNVRYSENTSYRDNLIILSNTPIAKDKATFIDGDDITFYCYNKNTEESWKENSADTKNLKPAKVSDIPFISENFRKNINPSKILSSRNGYPNGLVLTFADNENYVYGLNITNTTKNKDFGFSVDLKALSNSGSSDSNSAKNTQDLNIKLTGNGCYNETDNGKEVCDILDSQTNQKLATFRDCKGSGENGRCIFNSVYLGRKSERGQYILESGGEGGMGFVRVYEYNSKTKQVNKLTEASLTDMFAPECNPYLYKTWPISCKDVYSDKEFVDNYINYEETLKKYGPENRIYASFALLGAGMATQGYTLIENDTTREVYIVKNEIFVKALTGQNLSEKAKLQITGEITPKTIDFQDPKPNTKSSFEITKINTMIVLQF